MKSVRNGFQDVESAWKQLTATAHELGYAQSLTKGQDNRIKKLTSYPAGRSSSRSARKQTRFLNRVLHLDSTCYKLCAIAFSQTQVDSTKDAILDGLIKRIEERRDHLLSIHSGLRSLFVESEQPRVVQPPKDSNEGITLSLIHI